ncbi:MAG: protein-methionine-sulfoxide reductase heme-binding subunit MsrQ [Deltaproteobacteria bacterium]|nr:protein-methionine-sulfoxide reductase heme-binding subunit MsrQ [Deltaproteobacteria bacterium]
MVSRLKPAVFAAGLLPLAWLIYGAFTDRLGANPIEYITHLTGDWALRFLLLSLAVTPLRRLFGWNRLINYRRMLGLFAFFYAALHLSTWIGLDHAFDWPRLWADVRKRPYITAGMVAFSCLLPLAITSTRGWIRRLGKRWTTLHRLAYLAALAAVVHYWWLVKADVRGPGWYALALAVLLGVRLVFALRGRAAAAGPRRNAQAA